MTDEQVIQQIVKSKQWGNSALAEIHRRTGERLTCAVNRAVSTTLRQPDSAFTVATPRW